MIKTTVIVIAEVESAEESTKRIAAIVVIVFLDETNDLARRSRGSSKNDHVRGVDGNDLDLVPWPEIIQVWGYRKALRRLPQAGEVPLPFVLGLGIHP